METGKRVRAARGYADLSQPELAEKIQVGRNTVIRTEAGERTPKDSELAAIAEACGLGLAFFGYDFTAEHAPSPSFMERLATLNSQLEATRRLLAGQIVELESRVLSLEGTDAQSTGRRQDPPRSQPPPDA